MKIFFKLFAVAFILLPPGLALAGGESATAEPPRAQAALSPGEPAQAEGGSGGEMAYFQAQALVSCAPEYRDYKKAAKLFKDAASSGNAEAKCALAKLYLNGLGLKRDAKEALRLFSEAAAEGCAPAFYNMAVMYENSVGVERNIPKALEYYRKAAALGSSEAKEALEVMGESSPQSGEFADRYILPLIVLALAGFVISRLLGSFRRMRSAKH